MSPWSRDHLLCRRGSIEFSKSHKIISPIDLTPNIILLRPISVKVDFQSLITASFNEIQFFIIYLLRLLLSIQKLKFSSMDRSI